MSASIPPDQLEYYKKHADDNQQPNHIATITLCLALSCIAVFLRFIARRRTRAGYKADDWLILLALLPLAGVSTTTGLGMRYGSGKHIIFVENPEGWVKIYIAGMVIYSLTVILIKLSILYLYHRIFPSKALVLIARLTGALVLAYSGALIILAFLRCIPLSKPWNAKPGGVCVPRPAYVTLAIMNVFTDLMILSLPVRFVVRLQMKTARKLQVLGAFALGGLVCIFGIVRCYYVGKVSSTDPTWTVTPGAIWSQVEISVGIISACLPVYRPLFTRRSAMSGAKSSDHISKPKGNSRSIPLAARSDMYAAWSNNVTLASGQEDDLEDRPLAKPTTPKTVHQEVSFIGGREAQTPAWQV